MTSLGVLTFACFAAGAASVASPCVLPLVPAYLAAATSARGGMRAGASAPHAVGAGARFVAGFATVFVALGASSGELASVLPAPAQARVAGLVLVAVGMSALGLLPQPPVSRVAGRTGGMRGSPALLGAVFSLAATPCTTPLLGLGVAAAVSGATAARGAVLLAAYGAGMAATLVVVGGAVGRAAGDFHCIRRNYWQAMRIAGGATLAFGVLLALGQQWRLNVVTAHILDRVGS